MSMTTYRLIVPLPTLLQKQFGQGSAAHAKGRTKLAQIGQMGGLSRP